MRPFSSSTCQLCLWARRKPWTPRWSHFARSNFPRTFTVSTAHRTVFEQLSSKTATPEISSWQPDEAWSQQTPSSALPLLAEQQNAASNISEVKVTTKSARTWLDVVLSENARQVLGFKPVVLKGLLVRDETHSRGDSDIWLKNDVMRSFDHYCRNTGLRGLSSFVVALTRLGESLDAETSVVLGSDYEREGATVRCTGKVASGGAATFLYQLRCKPRGDHSWDIRLTGPNSESLSRCWHTVVLEANVNEKPQSTSITSIISARDEADFLADTIDMILKRLAAEMSFTNFEEAVCTLAEAVLRVVKFRNPYLSLASVKVLLNTEMNRGKVTALAAWKEPPGVVSSIDKQAVEVTVLDSKDEIQKESQPGQETYDEANEMKKEVRQTSMMQSSDSGIDLEYGAKYWHHLRGTSRGELMSGLDSSVSSEVAKLRFGFANVKFQICWADTDASKLPNLEFSRLWQIVQPVLLETSDRNLESLFAVTQSITDALPGISFAVFTLRDPGSDSLLKKIAGKECKDIWAQEAFITVRSNVLTSTKRIETARIRLPSIRLPGSMLRDATLGPVESLSLKFTLTWDILDYEEWRRRELLDLIAELYSSAMQRLSALVNDQSWESAIALANGCVRAVATVLSRAERPIDVKLSMVPNQISDAGKRRDGRAIIVNSGSAQTEAFIALGSNLGDRVAAIEKACLELNADESMQILEVSPLYQTKPMYVEDQGSFVNGVCKIRTTLSPLDLLDRLQAIEQNLGRVKIIEKGPRNIDLDILTFGELRMQTERLTIPHALMHEREFVLRPLCDTSGAFSSLKVPNKVCKYVILPTTLLERLSHSSTPMYALTPLAPGCAELRSLAPQRRTAIMSILNTTPDSFSDGGDNSVSDLEALKQTISLHIASGATIIDIGGQSSRPNAPDITAEEEISRVLPAIEAIKSLPEASNIAISIDTYRASVAEAAINAGAHIINDISAGLLDSEMLPTIAKLRCTYIMMHMRGTPSTMQSEENTLYPDGLIPTIASELQSRLRAAQEAGIFRWRIILDPGIGFAKTTEQNAELLGKFSELRNWKGLSTYPWLVGSSRKGFIGKLTGVEDAKDRIEGTAATVTAAVAGGAEIVRVHDVKEMGRVVKMADAMYRRG